MIPRWLKTVVNEIKRNPFNSAVGILSLLGLGTLGAWLSQLINLGREWFLFAYLPTLIIASIWYYFRLKKRVGRLIASGVRDFYHRYEPSV